MHIVLFEPEIPSNTGNIARTCVVTNSTLHLIKPLGFILNNKYLKRAGLDYWQQLDLFVHDNWQSFYEHFKQHSTGNLFLVTTKGLNCYSNINYDNNDFFVFGKETAGLPKKLLDSNPDKTIRIPMGQKIRSLNLANSVAIITYEALRQNNFPNLI